jgi:hypothetical protein
MPGLTMKIELDGEIEEGSEKASATATSRGLRVTPLKSMQR